MTTQSLTLHAGCVVVGEHGVLIRGASGAGKSYLARLILDHCAAHQRFAALVADDQVHLSRHDTPEGCHIIARPPENLAGLMEVRGLGIIRMPYEKAAVVRAVLDLTGNKPDATPLARLPDEGSCETCVLGMTLPCLKANDAHMALDLFISVLNLKNENGTSIQCRHVINESFPLAFRTQYGNDTHS